MRHALLLCVVILVGNVTANGSAGLQKESFGADGAAMLLVPEGNFWMGLAEEEGLDDEQPRHSVYLDAYYIDAYEVTTERYAKFLGTTGWEPPMNWDLLRSPEHAQRPVIGVNWSDADAYCRIHGRRLPTEAEWEKAARGVNERKFPWGDTRPLPSLAWFGQMSRFSYDVLKFVGSYPGGKSPYGAYDMAGNVSEWVQDWYDGDYYRESPARNPQGPTAGEYKVARGGSWSDMPVYLLSAGRSTKVAPTARNAFIGFRCARSVK